MAVLDVVLSRLRAIAQRYRLRETTRVDEMFELLTRHLPRFSVSYKKFMDIVKRRAGVEKEAVQEIGDEFEEAGLLFDDFLRDLENLSSKLDDFFDDFYVFKFAPSAQAVANVNKSFESVRQTFNSFMKKYSKLLERIDMIIDDFLALGDFSLYEPLVSLSELFGVGKLRFYYGERGLFERIVKMLGKEEIRKSFREFKGGNLRKRLSKVVEESDAWDKHLLDLIWEWGRTILDKLHINEEQWRMFLARLQKEYRPSYFMDWIGEREEHGIVRKVRRSI
jgi:hypothetical protein